MLWLDLLCFGVSLRRIYLIGSEMLNRVVRIQNGIPILYFLPYLYSQGPSFHPGINLERDCPAGFMLSQPT